MLDDVFTVGFESDETNDEVFRLLASSEEIDAFVVNGKNFDGTADAITLIASVSLATIAATARIILAKIKTSSDVSIVYDGIVIKGVSEEKIPEIMYSIAESRRKKSN